MLKLFCRHKDEDKEVVLRYYTSGYMYANYDLNFHIKAKRVYKCKKCGKLFTYTISDNEFMYEYMGAKTIVKLESMGYISYADAIATEKYDYIFVF